MKSFSSILGSVESEVTFRESLEPLPLERITGFEPKPELSRFSIFADEQFNVGAAWYCVDENSSAVYRISPEFGDGPEFVNSSVESYVASLEAAAHWSAEHDESVIKRDPTCIDALVQALSSVDQVAMTWPKNEWPLKIDHLRQSIDPNDDESIYYFRVEQ